MNAWFRRPWPTVPTVWVDTETTGRRPGMDKAVQVGFARFEGGRLVAEYVSLVNPCVPIPASATEIHGITDSMVEGEATIDVVFRRPEVQAIIAGAQPGAYNAPYDRWFLPPFCEDWTWPWLDALSLVRKIDRFEKGQGRHKLDAVAKRHGITHDRQHSALDDAKATGELFYLLAPRLYGPEWWLGNLLHRQALDEAGEWKRFNQWLSGQPPRSEENQHATV